KERQMSLDLNAGRLPDDSTLTNIPRLISRYYSERPEPSDPAQQVAFGTSGHRGSSLKNSFNEWHILAVTQAICDYRREQGIDGRCAATNGEPGYTPTPESSHAILEYNKGRSNGLADGIVITPSHNPPADGGFKYNPCNGGPADTGVTRWIQDRANALLVAG